MNKPVYLGLSILETSKTLMYEFWHEFRYEFWYDYAIWLKMFMFYNAH